MRCVALTRGMPLRNASGWPLSPGPGQPFNAESFRSLEKRQQEARSLRVSIGLNNFQSRKPPEEERKPVPELPGPAPTGGGGTSTNACEVFRFQPGADDKCSVTEHSRTREHCEIRIGMIRFGTAPVTLWCCSTVPDPSGSGQRVAGQPSRKLHR